MRLDMIGPPVGRDDDVVHRQVGRDRLDQHVSLAGRSRPALGVADLPLHRVPGGDRLQLLAGLERDIGDVHRSDVELVERPVAVRVDLDGVDVAGAGRIDAGGGIGELDAAGRIAGLGRARRPAAARHPLQLARKRQQLGHLNDLDGFGWFCLERRWIVIS